MSTDDGNVQPHTSSNRLLLRSVVGLGIALLVLIGLSTWTFLRVSGQAASQSQIQHTEAQIRSNQTTIHRVERSQQIALREGCERLNIQRLTANRTYLSDYNIAVIFFRAVHEKRPPSAPPQTKRQKRETRQFARAEHAAINGYEWTPLTDCRRAVNEHGIRYRSPQPVKFVTRLPPQSAISIEGK